MRSRARCALWRWHRAQQAPCCRTVLRRNSLNIPLQLVPVTTGGETYYRLGINVGFGSSAPKPYEFDTGSAPFNAAYSPLWWPSPLTSLTSLAKMRGYSYGSGRIYDGDVVAMPSISFYASPTATTPYATLPTIAPGYHVTAVTSSPSDSDFKTKIDNNQPVVDGAFFGVFGASSFVATGSTNPSSWPAPGFVDTCLG